MMYPRMIHVSGASHEMELRDLLGCTEEILFAAPGAVGFVSAITKLIFKFLNFCFQFIL